MISSLQSILKRPLIQTGKPTATWREILFKTGYAGLFLSTSGLVFAIFMRVSRFNGYRRVLVLEMINGQAYKPFVYRTLLPSLVRLIGGIVPDSAGAAYNAWLNVQPGVPRVVRILGWEPDHLVEYTILSILIFLSLVGFAFSMRYLFGALFRASSKVQAIIPLAAMLALPPFFNYTYLYDFSALFFFTLGLAYLAHRRWRAFLIVYLLGCLNKETIVLLTLIFVIHYSHPGRISRSRFWRLLLYQASIFLSVKAVLTLLFSSNPGSFVEIHFWDHNLPLLYGLLKPYSLSFLFLAFLVIGLFFYQWQVQPKFLRDSIWILLPLVGLTLALGFLDELRDYYEAYPVVFLLLFHNIGKIMNVSIQPIHEFGGSPPVEPCES